MPVRLGGCCWHPCNGPRHRGPRSTR